MHDKITYLIPTLKLAGTSTQALAFCDAMAKNGHEVELVIASPTGVFQESASKKPYPVKYFTHMKYFTRFFTVCSLVLYLLKQKPCVIISGAKGLNKLAIYAHLLSFKTSRLAIILTNDLLQRKSPSDKGRRLSRLWHLCIYRAADQVIVLTEAMKAEFEREGFKNSKVTVIAPPINTIEIREKSLLDVEHPWLTQPKSKRDIPVILAVGRIATQKNYFDLIEALSITNGRRPVRLIILGSGDKTESSRRHVKKLKLENNVSFIGFSDNPYAYMHRSDIFALSSHWEGFGIVVAEALACGLTTASYDCPDGPREILDGGALGYLAKLHDPTDLARAIDSAINSPYPYDALVEKAREYDSKVIAKKYQVLIENLLNPPIN